MSYFRWMFRQKTSALFLLFITFCPQQSAVAKDEAVDPRIKAAQEEQAVSDALKAQADAEKAKYDAQKAKYDSELAAMKAKYGDSDTKGRSGTVTIGEGAGYLAEAMAFHALSSVADRTSKRIVESVVKRGLECNFLLTTDMEFVKVVPLRMKLLAEFDSAINQLERSAQQISDLDQNIQGKRERLIEQVMLESEEIGKKLKLDLNSAWVDMAGALDFEQVMLTTTRQKELIAKYSNDQGVTEELDRKVLGLELFEVNVASSAGSEARDGLSAALVATPLILGAVSDIASFFRTDFTDTKRDVTIPSTALRSDLAYSLSQRKCRDGSVTVQLADRDLLGTGETFRKIELMREKSNELILLARTVLERLDKQIAKNAQQITIFDAKRSVVLKQVDSIIANSDLSDVKKTDALNVAAEKLASINDELSVMRKPAELKADIDAQTQKLLEDTNALIASFLARSGDSASLLERISLLDNVVSKIENGAILVSSSIVTQGGEVQTSQTAFTQGRASYMGGAGVEFVVTDYAGQYIVSGTERVVLQGTFKRRKGPKGLKPKEIKFGSIDDGANGSDPLVGEVERKPAEL